MATLNGFLNPKKIKTVKFAVSDRFCDEDGNPYEWELRCLSGEEIQEIQNECTVMKQVGNKVHTDFDNNKFQDLILTKSVIFPNPYAADLQEAHNKNGKLEKIFSKMLTGSEYLTLYTKAAEVNGLNKSLDDLVETAKN